MNRASDLLARWRAAVTRRRMQQAGDHGPLASLLTWRGGATVFLTAGAFYAVVYQLVIGQSLAEFGFGVVTLQEAYPAIPHLNIGGLTGATAYDLFATAVINSAAMTHYYLDSFIWKVSDAKTREGL